MTMMMGTFFRERQVEARRASAEDAERARAANHTVEMLLDTSVMAKRDDVYGRVQAERYDGTVLGDTHTNTTTNSNTNMLVEFILAHDLAMTSQSLTTKGPFYVGNTNTQTQQQPAQPVSWPIFLSTARLADRPKMSTGLECE